MGACRASYESSNLPLGPLIFIVDSRAEGCDQKISLKGVTLLVLLARRLENDGLLLARSPSALIIFQNIPERAGLGEFSFGMEPFSFGAQASAARVKEKASV